MQKTKKKFLLIGCIVLLTAIACFSAYVFRVYTVSRPMENIQVRFAAESVTGATDFMQSDALPYGKGGRSQYLTYIATGGTENAAEMFLIHNQPFLRITGFPRFVADAHYTADAPVGFACTVLKNVNGEDRPIGFLFSSNRLEIVRIDYRLRDLENGLVQEESFDVSLEPFARAFSLESENMQLESMVCYDFAGNIVYTTGV